MIKYSLIDYSDKDFNYCHDLCKKNMSRYYKKYHLTWHKNKFRKNLKDGIVKLVLIDGMNVGFFQIKFKEEYGYLNTIQLIKEYQGKGIGRRLMQEIHTIVKRDFNKIQLRVFEDNPAVNFYKSLGYKEIQREDNKLVMEKRVR